MTFISHRARSQLGLFENIHRWRTVYFFLIFIFTALKRLFEFTFQNIRLPIFFVVFFLSSDLRICSHPFPPCVYIYIYECNTPTKPIIKCSSSRIQDTQIPFVFFPNLYSFQVQRFHCGPTAVCQKISSKTLSIVLESMRQRKSSFPQALLSLQKLSHSHK